MKTLNLLLGTHCMLCKRAIYGKECLCHEHKENLESNVYCYLCGNICTSFSKFSHRSCALSNDLLISDMRCPFVYHGAAQGIIYKLKYYCDRSVLPFVATNIALAVNYGNLANEIDYLCPVPMTNSAAIVKGFHVSAALTRDLSSRINVPSILNLLVKVRKTNKQVECSVHDRLVNLKGAFEINPKHASKIKDKVIAVVDDVITTGATVQYCAMPLLEAGAKKVVAIGFARSNAPIRDIR